MHNDTTISSGQLTCLLLVSSATVFLTMNSALLGGRDLTDNLFSCLFAMLTGFLLLLPVFLLRRQYPKSDLLMQAQRAGSGLRIIFAVFYFLYVLLIDIQYLSNFQYVLGSTFSTGVPSWIFTVMLVLVALYAAYKGLEAIGRTAALILLLILPGICFLGVLLIPEIDLQNLTPPFLHGFGQAFTGTLYFLSGSYGIVTYALLFPAVSGKSGQFLLLWNGATWLIVALIVFLINGVLGIYASFQLFPLYSAATMAKLGTFQRMDTIFIGLWVVGIFLKLSLGIHLLSRCGEALFGRRSVPFLRPAAAFLHGAGAIIAASNKAVLNVLNSPLVTFPLTIPAVFLLPLLTGALNFFRERRRLDAS